jgi:sugar lactone lactonase YvrE
VNRKLIIVALAGAGVLALAGVLHYTKQLYSQVAVPAALQAVLKPAPASTKPDWAARVTTVAGNGVTGTIDGAAALSRFSDPFGVAVDARGNVYVADGGDSNRIRRIGPDGAVFTFAGGREGFADGTGSAAAFHTPSALALDRKGNLYVADTGNHAIRKITPDGVVTTLAGNGQPGFADGSGADARFNGPVGIAVDDAGVVYVADTYNDRIRRIARDGSVTTVAGNGQPGDADGAALTAGFDTPSGLAVARNGALYVADTGNDAIRLIGTDGLVSTLAVTPEQERRPVLRRPVGLALTHDGYLYIAASSGGRILQMAPNGEYRALGYADGSPAAGYGSDGTVRLYGPRGIALERDGSLLVADALAFRVHRLSASKLVEAAPAPIEGAPQRRRQEPMPWPVSPQNAVHEVVGLMGEVRGSYDGESRDHFHAGLDVKAEVGERVLAVAPAKVTDPFANWGFGTLSEGISVGSLSYIHMRVGRDSRGKALDDRFQLLAGARGKPVRVRVSRGTRFAIGDPLGTVNGQAHVHLDYYPGGPVINPLSLPFVGLSDSIAPRIQGVALYDSSNRRIPARKGRVHVNRSLGEVSIVVDAYDQMDGNLARRRLGLYKLGYQLLHADGSPVPGFEHPLITQVYDRLPRNREAVKLVYASNSGITVHGSKATRFAYAVNNTLLGGQATPGSWKVDALAPGDYTLRIYAADYGGQVATEGRDLALTVE